MMRSRSPGDRCAPGWSRLGAAAALAALASLPANGFAQQPPARVAKPAAGKASEDSGGRPQIGCPSLANYRMLMRSGPAGAAATLGDAKADHLGCLVLPQGRLAGIVDRVTIGGTTYHCATVQGTTACHWMAAASSEN